MRLVALTLAGLITAGAAAADRADTVSIVGSSTVYPFATAVAEAFGETTDFNTPVIESTGSGGGMKLFCAGVGLDHPDVTNASRRQKSSEAETCAANGVEFTEFMIGYDGIVLANSKNGGPALDMSKMQIAMGVLAEIPNADCTEFTANPYSNWSDIDASLPNSPILVLGPPTSSGTRDAFEELVIHSALKSVGCDKATYKAAEIREDGAYVESGENDTLIVSTPGGTFKRRSLDRDERVTLCIISNREPFNFVSVEGRATIETSDLAPGTRKIFENIADIG